MLWAGRHGRVARHFPLSLGWTSKPLGRGWTKDSPRSLGLMEARDDRFSVLDIPEVAVYHRRAENEVGAPGTARSALGSKGEEGRGREVPTQVRVLSLGLDWNTGRPSIGRLETAH